MQPFDGYENESADRGQSRPGNLNNNGRETSYSKRPFTELVDEANHGMVRRKICATFFGGYRTSVSGFSDSSIGCGLHIC